MKIDQAEDLHRLYGQAMAGTDAVPLPDFENGIKIAGTTFDATSVGALSSKILSNAAVSSDLSATSLTTFSNGTATIAAGQVAAGDTLRYKAVVRVKTVDGTDSLRVYVKYAGATIFDSTAVSSVVQDDLIVITGEITVRTVHASTGTAFASVTTIGELAGSPVSLGGGSTLTSLANAASHTLIVQAIWGGAGNAAVLEQFNVYQN